MRKTFSNPGWTAGLLLGIATATVPAQVPAPSPAPSAPPRTNDPQAAALDLLRRVIAEQQKNPNKIIRVPGDASVAPSRDSKPSAASTGPRLTRAELEQQFLEGKITAKQFQRAAEDLEKNPPPPTPPPPAPVTAATEKGAGAGKEPSTAALSPKASSALPGKTVTNQPSAKPLAAAGEDNPEDKAFADVEAKIDEILARRHALSQAAKTNDVSTNAAPAGPLTKRQKLDGLLRQLIQGKLTEQEYNAQREKVLAQPD